MDNDKQNTTKVCSGDCLQCSVQQRAYCAAQMPRNIIGMLGEVMKNQALILERIGRVENVHADMNRNLFHPMPTDEEVEDKEEGEVEEAEDTKQE